MAKHMASTTIAASPEKVWEVVSDSSRLAEWLSPLQGVDKVEPAGPLAMGTKVEGTLGNIGGAKLSFKQAEPTAAAGRFAEALGSVEPARVGCE